MVPRRAEIKRPVNRQGGFGQGKSWAGSERSGPVRSAPGDHRPERFAAEQMDVQMREVLPGLLPILDSALCTTMGEDQS